MSELTEGEKENLAQGWVPVGRARAILRYNDMYKTKYDPDNHKGYVMKPPEITYKNTGGKRRQNKLTSRRRRSRARASRRRGRGAR